MNKKVFVSIFLLACACFFFSCRENQKPPDIGNIHVNLRFLRFEQDLFKSDFENLKDNVAFFQKKYGEFLDIFNYKIIHIGDSNNPSYPDLLKGFVTDYNMNQVYKALNATFNNTDSLKIQLTDMFRYFKCYFPEMPVPVVITYLSGFNQTIVTSDTILGIGLDKYLGSKCEFYNLLDIPFYSRYNMNKAKIPSDCARAWAVTQFPMGDSVSNLLANILYQGKVLYFTKALLPMEADTLIMGISASKLKWCKGYEEKMWTYLVENKLLFKTDYLTINKFIGEGPFTKDFGKSSPAKAAVWIGWQIINNYMKHNPDIGLKALMKDNDYQNILRLSRYKP